MQDVAKSLEHKRCPVLARKSNWKAANSFLCTLRRRARFSLRASEHPGVLAQAYLSKIGLKPYQNARLIGEMEAKGLVGDEHSPNWLEGRINALAHLLDAAQSDSLDGAAGNSFKPFFPLLLYNGGLALLQQDVGPMKHRLEELSSILPGTDVVQILCHVPTLLYTPDAVSSVQAAVDKLVAIYPYRVADKREEVFKLVEEYPELLLRIPLYCQDWIRTVEDLPVDLQNRIFKNYC